MIWALTPEDTIQGERRNDFMNEFKRYHPLVIFIYFVFAIGYSMLFMHPAYLALSFVCAFIYSVMLKGASAVKINLLYMLPLMAAAAVINLAFNHEGATILSYLPSGNPLTLESIVYGFSAALMIAGAIGWFSCFNEVMTSDKIICLFGRIVPSFSLVFSMTMRFIPQFISRIKEVSNAQKCIGLGVSEGNIIKRIKRGISILSVMTTWSLENSIETADSMKSRGYGLTGRTSFSVFTFGKRDKILLLCITMLGIYILTGKLTGGIYFRYFPSFEYTALSAPGISFFAAYAVLLMLPLIIEIWEGIKWKAIKSRI